ncbi:GBS Bsp-like repeat-containing protein, partial [[Clostridium] spiroforme]|nr:GBS Bsp-like repeat-containing protein [Thomasclavelia spiroformis]
GIQFVVWSEANGRDDLKWYRASRDSEGNYVYTVRINDHRTAGQYQVHCYMDMINGGSSILSATVFVIGQPELKMTAEDLGNGKFRVDVEVSGQKAEIEKLEI